MIRNYTIEGARLTTMLVEGADDRRIVIRVAPIVSRAARVESTLVACFSTSGVIAVEIGR